MTNSLRFAIVTLALFGLGACGGGGGGGDSDSGDGASASDPFPIGLAVASPTARSTGASGRVVVAGAVGGSQYEWATAKISGLLDGTLAANDAFDAGLLLLSASNAGCYGPTMDYQNHPDVSGGPASGQLPSGDLGIWKEVDDASGHACAAAELNSQLNGVSNRASMGLIGLAGMINVASKAGIALPAAGASVNLSSAMNAAGIPKVTFTTATLALSADGTTWNYDLAFSYSDGMGAARNIVLALTHVPGATDDAYHGMFTYRLDDQPMGGNCGGFTTGATTNGTLYYKRSSATDLLVNSREGGYCGSGVVAATTSDSTVDGSGSYAFLDGSVSYDHVAHPDGWANRFAIFAGKFNPSTQEGDYVYAWQAGSGDSHSRVFQIGMNADAADGEAYFGFGHPVGASDGSILGMICNWAIPGSNHTPQPYVQRQFISFNSTTGKFDVPTGGSDITYAPTNLCSYDGTGSFAYDRDIDGTIGDADDVMAVLVSGTASSTQLVLDLMKQDTAATMQEAINDRGFTLPPF